MQQLPYVLVIRRPRVFPAIPVAVNPGHPAVNPPQPITSSGFVAAATADPDVGLTAQTLIHC